VSVPRGYTNGCIDGVWGWLEDDADVVDVFGRVCW
jgi:hypothetical protein